MKKLLVLIISALLSFTSFSQERIETLFEHQSFQLNSGGRALLGGQSRTYLAVQIPRGAKAIAYAVVGYVNLEGGQNIKLAAQLTAMLTGNVALASAIRSVNVPQSNAVVDIYALPNDNNNLSYFLNKNDQYWSHYAPYSCISSLGCKMAIPVSPDMNVLYLGFRNPSAVNRIVIVVDVVAVY